MNFFEQQEHARRQTRTLVILFVFAVITIVVAVNVALALAWSWTTTGYVLGMHDYPRGFFLTNTLITVALIAGGTLIEMFNLRDGGDAVAQMAGGRLVAPASNDMHERRLLNIVEEMSLASGVACPRVYVLDKEPAINAFAAGYNQDQAVVAVTRGTLERLSRDELQGVIAHEFSHILNGDMRLNIRLIGLLFGIQMIAGFGMHLMNFGSHTMAVRSRDDRGSARVVLLLTGVALFVIGYIGIFFGRLIKSAVSRQREFLADASAVQFTRNPDGIGGALRKIGGLSSRSHPGSRIEHPNAEQLSHLFLGAPRQNMLKGMLATHPPIEERLRRIFGRKVDMLDAPPLPPEPHSIGTMLPDIPYETSSATAVASGLSSSLRSAGASSAEAGSGSSMATPAQQATWTTFGAGAQSESRNLPPALDSATHDPQAACALVYALLLEKTQGGEGRTAQLAILQQHAPDQAALTSVLADAMTSLPQSARLPLLDRAMPALTMLSEAERLNVLANADRLIAADNRRTLAEFVVETVLARRLDAHSGRPAPVRYEDLRALRADCAALVSLVAHVGASTVALDDAELFALGAAQYPKLQLSPADMVKPEALDFVRVRTALEHAHQLAPLAKPILIKMLLAAAGKREPMPVALADLLRAICAAIEAPVPPVVADTYTNQHW